MSSIVVKIHVSPDDTMIPVNMVTLHILSRIIERALENEHFTLESFSVEHVTGIGRVGQLEGTNE